MTETISAPPRDLPAAVEFQEASDGIECYRLAPNDLRILLLPQEGAPVATSMVTYHVGSRNERTGHTGATHMLEHLMFKGTERYHKREGTSIFETLQRVGAKVNASTWLDRTNYFEMLPTEHLPLALDIEADRMRGALLDPQDVEDERTVILNERDRKQNDPVSRLFDEVWGAAFVAHPYHHPTIGWKSDIEDITAEGLREYYDTFYWPNNATLSIVGQFDRAAALSQVADHFGPIDAAAHDIPQVTTDEPEQSGQRRVRVRQDGQLGAVLMGFKSPPALNAESDVLDVLARILASGKGSRLYRRCTDQGLTSDVFGINFRLRDPGLFSVFAYLAPDQDHETVEGAIEDTIEDIKTNGVTEEELDRARSQLRAQIAFDRDGPMRVASQLNEALAAGDWTLYTQYLDRLDDITVDDVQRVAREYLTSETSTVGWYVPSEE
ncbi:MAG: M16 family metallopeptidase [Salinibacter sp.]|uniref:M16 family metallopeptidase n=1 Tax=Salinibacter sp. TaxID=2065818 RepID=UPI0035D41739